MGGTSVDMRDRSVRIARAVFVVLLGAFLSGCASEPAAREADPRIPWDQAKVTELARELHASVVALRRAALADPMLRSMQRAGGGNAAGLYLDGLRDLERATGQVARQLEAGQGFEQTLEGARRVGMLLRDVQVQSRRLDISEAQWQVIDPAIDILHRLSPYYSSEWPLMSPRRR